MHILVIVGAMMWTGIRPLRAAESAPGSLVKTVCPSGVDVNHPCRAVYYYGYDDQRHAFPNVSTFYSWYTDFSTVRTVSSGFLASLPLGRSVTYRPGVRMVKFATDPKTYAVALGGTLRGISDETTAAALYGVSWNRQIDDISDAFFANYRFGDAIRSGGDYDAGVERAFASSIDADLPRTHRSADVVTVRGTFRSDVIALHRDRYAMRTSIAGTASCADDCPAIDLRAHAAKFGASVGMHGSYFCPPDYTDCAAKVNTFFAPFLDSGTRFFANEQRLHFHDGPIATFASDGQYRFFRNTKEFGDNVGTFTTKYGVDLVAAAANYPALMADGRVVVESESRFEESMRTKGVRGGLGWNDRFIFLVIARNASVIDLASVLQSLGARDAMNLDGGGSIAMFFNGSYLVGPGRLLPNAILFGER